MKCKSEESASGHTLFHNVKIPLNKAFFIAINYLKSSNDFSIVKFSLLLNIKEITCWKLKNKIEKRITLLLKSKNNKIKEITITEIMVGTIKSPF